MQTFWLVIRGKSQLLLITLTSVQVSSVPASCDSDPANPDTEVANLKSTIMNLIIYTCAFQKHVKMSSVKDAFLGPL